MQCGHQHILYAFQEWYSNLWHIPDTNIRNSYDSIRRIVIFCQITYAIYESYNKWQWAGRANDFCVHKVVCIIHYNYYLLLWTSRDFQTRMEFKAISKNVRARKEIKQRRLLLSVVCLNLQRTLRNVLMKSLLLLYVKFNLLIVLRSSIKLQAYYDRV